MKKIVARIFGGLGNQLFCYAAARRLSLVQNAELVLDDVSGFAEDYAYRRSYQMDRFNISCRKATPRERFEPFPKLRRGFARIWNRRLPYSRRWFIEQEGRAFDLRLLSVKVNGTLHLEGYWQSERYFKDVGREIREDLQMIPPNNRADLKFAEKIHCSDSVAVHVRWFDGGLTQGPAKNAPLEYYRKAFELMENQLEKPRYFVFSDDYPLTRSKITLPPDRTIFVDQNSGDRDANMDLWLMSQCKHFITANSTFSWWGAWLGNYCNKLVVTPGMQIDKGAGSWGFDGLIPEEWIKL